MLDYFYVMTRSKTLYHTVEQTVYCFNNTTGNLDTHA